MENVPVGAVRKESYADSLMEQEGAHNHIFPWKEGNDK